MISLNVLEVALSVEFNHGYSDPHARVIFVVVENIFCAFFTAEILVRSFTYLRCYTMLQDAWFIFAARHLYQRQYS